VSLYRDTGVVLRVQKLGEADRIITLLTRRHGPVRAVAKGVRRTSSRFGARLEPFGHIDVQFYRGRTLDIITQVETVDGFGSRLVGDYGRYTTGCAVLETAERLAGAEGEPALRLYLLVVGALRALADGQRHAPLVLDAFLLRAMAAAGWAPALTECARCGIPGTHPAFSVPAGGLVCPECRPPGAATPSAAALALLDALMHGDWRVAEATPAPIAREASGLVAAHLQWHLERQLRSLPLVERSRLPHSAGSAGSSSRG
jgi:DNA repair protein RecO (recombination protein O)